MLNTAKKRLDIQSEASHSPEKLLHGRIDASPPKRARKGLKMKKNNDRTTAIVEGLVLRGLSMQGSQHLSYLNESGNAFFE